MKKSVKNILVLVCICSVVSVLLAITNTVTAPRIARNEYEKVKKALLEVMPDGKSFAEIDVSAYTFPSTVTAVYKSENGGYVINLKTTGYASGMVMMCGVSAEGKVTGTKTISSNETPSIGGAAIHSFSPDLIGKDGETVDGVDTVGGATKTTAAYRSAVKDALNAALILRTNESIFEGGAEN